MECIEGEEKSFKIFLQRCPESICKIVEMIDEV
jgi:hypothetical protein